MSKATKKDIKMDIEKLEKRIHNLELAFVAYTTITQDLLPPAYAEEVDNMMQDFYGCTKSLGGYVKKGFEQD